MKKRCYKFVTALIVFVMSISVMPVFAATVEPDEVFYINV